MKEKKERNFKTNLWNAICIAFHNQIWCVDVPFRNFIQIANRKVEEEIASKNIRIDVYA